MFQGRCSAVYIVSVNQPFIVLCAVHVRTCRCVLLPPVVVEWERRGNGGVLFYISHLCSSFED